MIEKLSEYEITSRDSGAFINVECNTKIINTLVRKLNEIIGTIYNMQLAISNLDPDSDWYDGNHIADISKKVDPYAEQRKALDKGMEHITGLNNMIESWYKLINSDLDQETKLRILKSAISAYVENKGGDNE